MRTGSLGSSSSSLLVCDMCAVLASQLPLQSRFRAGRGAAWPWGAAWPQGEPGWTLSWGAGLPGSGSFPVWIRQCLRPPLMSGSGTELMDCRAAFTEACLGPAFQNEDVSNLAHPPVARTGLPPLLCRRRPRPPAPRRPGPVLCPPSLSTFSLRVALPPVGEAPCCLVGLPGSLETLDSPGGDGACAGCSGLGGSAPRRVVLATWRQLVWCVVVACACFSWVLPGAVAAASVSPGLGFRGGDLRQWCRNTASSDAGVRFADARGSALQAC